MEDCLAYSDQGLESDYDLGFFLDELTVVYITCPLQLFINSIIFPEKGGWEGEEVNFYSMSKKICDKTIHLDCRNLD